MYANTLSFESSLSSVDDVDAFAKCRIFLFTISTFVRIQVYVVDAIASAIFKIYVHIFFLFYRHAETKSSTTTTLAIIRKKIFSFSITF